MAIETLPVQPVEGDSPIIYTARQLRAHLLANVFSREGVIDKLGGHFEITQRAEGANFSIDARLGPNNLAGAAIFGDDQAGQGPYSVISTTKVNKSVPTPSTTVTRTHRVILRTFDRLENSSLSPGTYYSDVVVQPDTAAAAALPATSIPLASIAVPANALSITDSMITDLRKPASVGTPALQGTFTLASSIVPMDATRPLRWEVNPDGWVMLSGWARYNGGTFTVPAGFQQPLADGAAGLSDPNVKPPGIRDFPMSTKNGCLHCAVFPSGNIYVRNPVAMSFVANDTWLSFDGCFYRL